MKFDASQWVEVAKNAEFEVEERLRLQVDRQVALYTREGEQTIVCGFGSSFDLKFAGFRQFWISDAEATVAIYMPRHLIYKPTGVRMTNADRQVRESGAVAEVTRALRMFKYERKMMAKDLARMAQMRRELEAETVDPETGEVKAKAEKPAKDEQKADDQGEASAK